MPSRRQNCRSLDEFRALLDGLGSVDGATWTDTVQYVEVPPEAQVKPTTPETATK